MLSRAFARKKPSVVPPSYMVQVQNLGKDFDHKRHRALVDLSFDVSKGQIFGLIGANGAGKTTALKIMATILSPNQGDVLIDGQSIRQKPLAVRRIIGYVPDEYGLYNEMQIDEYLEFFASCYGIRGKKRTRLVSELLDLVDLQAKRKQQLKGLSRGMKQRLCLAHALVHDPQVLLLDEPASGLDPRGRVEMRELLRELAYMGKTVVISSHALADVQDICDAVGIMAQGRILEQGQTDRIAAKGAAGLPSRQLIVRLVSLADLQHMMAVAPAFPQIEAESLLPDPTNRRVLVDIQGDENTCAAFLSYLTAQGIAVAQFIQRGSGLEELFGDEV